MPSSLFRLMHIVIVHYYVIKMRLSDTYSESLLLTLFVVPRIQEMYEIHLSWVYCGTPPNIARYDKSC